MRCPQLGGRAPFSRGTPDRYNRDAIKLHTQYGHAPAARLNALFKDQGVTDDAVFAKITAIVAACEVCARSGPRPPRPLVTVPRGIRFNDTAAVDLTKVDPLHRFLHVCGGNPLTEETRPPGMSRGRVVNSHATPP